MDPARKRRDERNHRCADQVDELGQQRIERQGHSAGREPAVRRGRAADRDRLARLAPEQAPRRALEPRVEVDRSLAGRPDHLVADRHRLLRDRVAHGRARHRPLQDLLELGATSTSGRRAVRSACSRSPHRGCAPSGGSPAPARRGPHRLRPSVPRRRRRRSRRSRAPLERPARSHDARRASARSPRGAGPRAHGRRRPRRPVRTSHRQPHASVASRASRRPIRGDRRSSRAAGSWEAVGS